ncbi:MAG TPA: hypothetical protein VFQ32_11875 [Ktedonobacterales bacterium]|nr:hypothetical protein [Ktedonobacterales bacterium]
MENVQRYKPYIIIGAIVATAIVIAFVIVATWLGWWPVVVDIVLVVTALISLVMLGGLTYATIVLIRTIQGARDEIMPVLESLKATTSTVQATAKTASAFGVSPSVRTASFVVGAGEIASTIFGRGRPRKRSEQRQQRRREIEREMSAEGASDDHR